jgi:hypothetical protein
LIKNSYTRACDKITRVITSCKTVDQLIFANKWCFRMTERESLKNAIKIWDLIDKLIHTQMHVISRTSKIL